MLKVGVDESLLRTCHAFAFEHLEYVIRLREIPLRIHPVDNSVHYPSR